MTDNVLPLTPVADLLRTAKRSGGKPPDPPDDEDEYPAYARLRNPAQVAFMLELRQATGECTALDYGHLWQARLDPSGEVTLHFARAAVTITGKNLWPLYEAVVTHRATWVREAPDPAAVARDPDATVVTRIRIDRDGE